MRLAVAVSRRIGLNACLILLSCITATHAAAQNINAGRLAYTTPQVAGQKSCSDSSCHANDPRGNQNRILKGADDPGAIGLAVNTVAQMAFLKPAITTIPFADLAAYLANPGGVTGTPVAQLSPATLTFPSTVVGSSAATQPFSISNTGTAALVVSSVTSSNSSEFTLVSSCGTIVPAASCNVTVGFTPTAAGSRSATISVNHNAAGGSSSMAVSGTAIPPVTSAPGVQMTPSSLSFGSVTVGSFSGVQNVTVNSVGTAPLTLTAISSTNSAFTVSGGSCVAGAVIAVGSSCTISLRFQPTAAGAQTAMLNVSQNASVSAASTSLSGTGVAGTSSLTKTMVEYVFVPLNYFFVTSRDEDKVLLDAIADFKRTGLSFPVYTSQVANSRGISRFYFDKVAVQGSRGSHFYTLLDSDKAALAALNPGNTQAPKLPYDEGIDSWAILPVVSGPGGSCASGQTPIYRLFRGGTRFPDDPNHRFTADLATYNAYVALGWDGEGVNFCVPAP